MEKISALRIVQRGLEGEEEGGSEGLTLYIAGMTLAQMSKYAKVDMWSPDNSEGYQRPLIDRRLRELAKYIQEEEGILPTSVLVGTRTGDEPRIEPTGFGDGSENVSVGELCIPDGATLWVIDGQHRFYGVKYAYDRGAESLKDYPFPICVMWDIERYLEMVHFNIVNTRQRKMSTDIVDRHLVQMQSVKGIQMMASGARGEKEYLRATATRIVDRLDEAPGVWQNQIAIPGVPGRDQGLVRQHAMVVSIEPFLKDPWVRGASEDDTVHVLVNFWDAAKEVWPDAFDSPKDHRVQATVGIYSLHLLLPVLIQRCLEARDLSKDKMKGLLGEMGVYSAFWHKEDGDPPHPWYWHGLHTGAGPVLDRPTPEGCAGGGEDLN